MCYGVPQDPAAVPAPPLAAIQAEVALVKRQLEDQEQASASNLKKELAKQDRESAKRLKAAVKAAHAEHAHTKKELKRSAADLVTAQAQLEVCQQELAGCQADLVASQKGVAESKAELQSALAHSGQAVASDREYRAQLGRAQAQIDVLLQLLARAPVSPASNPHGVTPVGMIRHSDLVFMQSLGLAHRSNNPGKPE